MAQRLTIEAVETTIKGRAPGQRVRLWDATSPGLFLQVTPKGAASYFQRLKTPAGRQTDRALGRVWRMNQPRSQGEINLAEARAEAAKVLAAATISKTVPKTKREQAQAAAAADALRRAEERRARASTFETLAEAFMASPENQSKAKRTIDDRRWLLDRHVLPQLGARPFAELRARDIRDTVWSIQKAASKEHAPETLPKSRRGNRVAMKSHALVRLVFNWAVDEDLIEQSPVTRWRPEKRPNDKPVKRRLLSDDAIRTLWLALDGERTKTRGKSNAIALMLCALTLQRPNEVAGATEEDFDWTTATWHVPETKSKTGEAYDVPLSAWAVELWREAFKVSGGRWAFPQRRGEGDHVEPRKLSHRFIAIRKRLVKAGNEHVERAQLYDARRAGRTILRARLGLPKEVVERVISHAPPRGIDDTYDVADYSAAVRRAHEAWAAELGRIAYGHLPETNIVMLEGRRASA